jgi:hypothetical protein
MKLSTRVYFLRNNGEALAYLTKLKARNGGWVELYTVEPLEFFAIPEAAKRVGKYLAQHPRTSIKNAIAHTPGVKNLEELKECKIKYERIWE